MVAPQATLIFPHGASYIEHRLWVYSSLGFIGLKPCIYLSIIILTPFNPFLHISIEINPI